MKRSLKTKLTAPIAALGAALALSAAVPAIAQAQPYRSSAVVEINYRNDRDYDFRGLERRIEQGQRNGDLTRREARSLRWELRELRERADDYSRHGMNRWERRDLNNRYQQLSARIYSERRDFQDRDRGHHDGYRNRNW